ncbi:hypothetical protein ACJW31_05G194300 [Castanea mollissima]
MSHVAKLVSMSALTIQKLLMQLLRPKYSLLAVTKDITRQQERRARKQIANKEGTGNREKLQLNFEVNKEDREGFFLMRGWMECHVVFGKVLYGMDVVYKSEVEGYLPFSFIECNSMHHLYFYANAIFYEYFIFILLGLNCYLELNSS